MLFTGACVQQMFALRSPPFLFFLLSFRFFPHLDFLKQVVQPLRTVPLKIRPNGGVEDSQCKRPVSFFPPLCRNVGVSSSGENSSRNTQADPLPIHCGCRVQMLRAPGGSRPHYPGEHQANPGGLSQYLHNP